MHAHIITILFSSESEAILMKTINHFLLSALIVLLTLISASHLTAEATAAPAAVLDVSGRELRSGTKYYILPALRGQGGGLTLAGRNKTCPFNVVQEVHEVSPGLPLTFHPVNPKKGVVRLSTDLNVAFPAATICAKSTVWKLDGVEVGTGRRYVGIGGVVGNPGGSTVSNWFKIEKFGKQSYKLVFCPTVCKYCKQACGDVGVINGGGRSWLGLSGKPFPIMFKKVK